MQTPGAGRHGVPLARGGRGGGGARARGDVRLPRARPASVPDGRRHVRWDRVRAALPAELARAAYDAVVDVGAASVLGADRGGGASPTRTGSSSRRSTSTPTTPPPAAGPATLPLREPQPRGRRPARATPRPTAPMKVACEQIVTDGRGVRDGGPARPDRRPRRPDRPLHLLAGAPGRHRRPPGGAGRRARRTTRSRSSTSATWRRGSSTCAEQRRTGTFDGTGRATTRAAFVDAVAAAARELGLHDPTTTTFTGRRPGLPGRRTTWSRGRGRARCRCGCRCRSTPG